MSIEVMTRVWKHSQAYGGDILILLAIANYADENGRAYPSIPTLAQRGRMSERNAQYCIQHLEALGELKVERNAGPHGCHLFQVTIPEGGELIAPGANSSGVKIIHPRRKHRVNKELTQEGGANSSGVQIVRGEAGFTGGVKPIAPESSLDPSLVLKTEVTTSVVTSSDLSTRDTVSKLGAKSPRRKLPKSQEPGELHEKTTAAILGMVCHEFHCLAKPTKLNEQFWDAQIVLVDTCGACTIYDCLRSVDAYYSTNPEKRPINETSARRRMGFGIKYALQDAQKHRRSHHAQSWPR
jgi:Helix-turn-helix domain